MEEKTRIQLINDYAVLRNQYHAMLSADNAPIGSVAETGHKLVAKREEMSSIAFELGKSFGEMFPELDLRKRQKAS